MLKSLVSVPNYKGSLSEIQERRAKHLSTLRKQTLGLVVSEFFEKIYLPEELETESVESSNYEIRFRLSGGDREQLKEQLEKLVLERNELIHSRLIGFDPSSAQSCSDTESFLDNQHERLAPVFDEIKEQFEFLKIARELMEKALNDELEGGESRGDV